MPKMTEAVQRSTGSLKQELSDAIARNVDPAAHPFVNTIMSGPKIKQMLVEFHAKDYPAVTATAIADGTAATDYTRTTRTLLQAYAHYFRQGYGVTPLANRTDNAAGIGRRELAEQRADALVLLERQKEIQFTSTSDTAADNGSTGYTSRGAFSWLSSSAQGTLPVNASFRPAAANHYTDAFANYNEDDLVTQLNSMFGEAKSRLNLDFFAGISLKSRVDTATIVQPTASSTNQPRAQYVQQGLEKFVQNVNLIDTSAAMVRIHLVTWINYDPATGAANARASQCGLLINKDMWQIRSLSGVTHLPLADDGSGPRGIYEDWSGLFCLNPLGQGYVLPGS